MPGVLKGCASLLIILLVLPLTACARTAEPDGPYDFTPLTTSKTQVQERLGQPDSVDSDGTIWHYRSRGLEIQFFDDQLVTVYQFKGKITSDIAIGDDDSVLISIAGPGAVVGDELRDFTLERNGCVYVIETKHGKVVSARCGLAQEP